MNSAEKAAFKFIQYKISKFSFDEESDGGGELDVKFDVSGKYVNDKTTYELYIQILVLEGKRQIVNATMISYFKFDPNTALKDLPGYFYKNAIAISFPFLRAFISTLTLQTNSKPLMLPIMNLSNLEKPLIDNTTEVN